MLVNSYRNVNVTRFAKVQLKSKGTTLELVQKQANRAAADGSTAGQLLACVRTSSSYVKTATSPWKHRCVTQLGRVWLLVVWRVWLLFNGHDLTARRLLRGSVNEGRFRLQRTVLWFHKHIVVRITRLWVPPETILLHSMEQIPSWEANSFSASQEIPAFYGTRKFITAFTSACHLSLFWASSIPSMPHPTSWGSISILSSHLYLGLPSVLFSSGILTKTLYARFLSPIGATYPAHLIIDLIT